MKISLKEGVTFCLCCPHICQGFNLFCQKGHLLAVKYLVYFLPRVGTGRPKVNLHVVCELDQLTIIVEWRKVIQRKAKPGTFELFQRPNELCVRSNILQNLQNDCSAGQQLYAHADQRVARAVDEKLLG